MADSINPADLQAGIDILRRQDTEADLQATLRLRNAQRLLGHEGLPTNDDLLAGFVGQESLGEPTPDPNLRGFLSIMGDTFDERKLALGRLRPRAEMVEVPGIDDVLYRNSPDEQFRKLDPGFFEAMGMAVQDAGKFFRDRRFDPGRRVGAEVAADVADVFGSVPEILGETALNLLTRGRGAVREIAMMTGGAVLGETAQQQGQTLAGTQLDTPAQQRHRQAGAGIESIIGGTVATGVGAGINVVSRRGISNVPQEGVQAMRAQERISAASGVEQKPLLPSQVTDVPFIRLIGRQSQALVSNIARYLTEQERRTFSAVRSFVDPVARRQFINQTVNAFNRAGQDVVRLAQQGAAITRPRDFAEIGQALQKGVTAWWKAAGSDVDNLFGIARALQEPAFNASPAVAEAQRLVTGVQAPTAAGGTVRAGEIDPSLLNIAQRISKLNPAQQTVETLRGFRSELYELTLPGPSGEVRLGQSQAIGLRQSLNNVLDNPLGADPAFVAAWRAANDAAKTRFATREQLSLIDTTRYQSPSALAKRVIDAAPGGGSASDLRVIRETLQQKSPVHWERFTEGFRAELIDQGVKNGDLSARLAQFDQDALNILMDSGQQAVFRRAARQIDGLQSTGVLKARANQTEIRGFFNDVLNTNNTAGIAAMRDIVEKQGGIDTPFGRSVRATIIDEISRRSEVVQQGVARVDFNQMKAVLDDFGDRGLLRFLKNEEVAFLRDVKNVQDFSRLGVTGAGTSIQAAEAAAGFPSQRALATMIKLSGVGMWVTSAAGRRVLIGAGRGRRPLDFRMLRNIGAAAENIRSDNERQQELGADFEGLVRGVAMIPGRVFELGRGVIR